MVSSAPETVPTRQSTDSGSGQGTMSTSRAVDVLFYLMNNEGKGGITEISRALGLSKAVVYRILQTFREKGLVEAGDPPKREYRIGPTAALLGAFAPDPFEGSALHSAAMPHLKRMSEITMETATVSALVGRLAVHVDQVVSQRELRMTVKTYVPRPLTRGASSKAMLAFLDADEQRDIMSEAVPGTAAYPLEDSASLRRELETIRESGVAVSFGERECESAAIASPVWDSAGLVGAISICGPLSRFVPDVVASNKELVIATAEEISTTLRRG